MIDIAAIRERFLALSAYLDERSKRIFAATEARTAGYGGVAAVSRATGIVASTIGRGLAELSATNQLAGQNLYGAFGVKRFRCRQLSLLSFSSFFVRLESRFSAPACIQEVSRAEQRSTLP